MIKDTFKDFVLVCGLARSGTSWLGKILDSDPYVLYRYEPFNLEECVLFRELSEEIKSSGKNQRAQYLLREGFEKLVYLQNKHTTGQGPRFKKGYAFFFDHLFFKKNVRYVVKEVEFEWGLDWISEALGRPKMLFVIRHPCGNVNSYIKGRKFGMGKRSIEEWARIWLKVHEDIGLLDNVNIPDFKLVVYEKLCKQPLEETKNIFRFLGWNLSAETENFIRHSTARDSSGYWSVYKDPLRSANKWKEELTKEEVDKIYDVVGKSELMKLWE